VKGPTESLCAHAGLEQSARGTAAAYEGLIDAIVADEDVPGLPSLTIDTLMDTRDDRRRVALAAVELARSL
jgi:hypothetical protein